MGSVSQVNLLPAASVCAADLGEGFWFCEHCDHVIHFREEPEPDSLNVALKCPRCKKYSVKWRLPMAPRVPRAVLPVNVERGTELFRAMLESLEVVSGGGNNP